MSEEAPAPMRSVARSGIQLAAGRNESSPFAPFMPNIRGPALTSAFSRRTPPFIHGRGGHDVEVEHLRPTVDAQFATPREGPSIAYVHIPFCHNHCLFCGFYRNAHRDALSAPFVDRLLAEVARKSQTKLIEEGPAIEALYLGGGTPTALAAGDIFRLVKGLRRYLPLHSQCEITLEGRLYGFPPDKIEAALASGVTRVSLGIQSFDTQVRRRLGRKLSREELLEALQRLIDRDRAAVVIDLMYGLPGQTPKIWHRDLEDAASLQPDGLSVYALNIWPKGSLDGLIAAGKALPVPTLAEQAEAYAAARQLLSSRGWFRQSQAHLTRTPRERNLYNRHNKAGAVCLAFGPGAGGTARGFSWHNEANLERWEALVAAAENPVAGLRRLPAHYSARACIAAALEEGRLDCNQIELLAPGLTSQASELLAAWENAGLMRRTGHLFVTTVAGDFWMTTLVSGLVSVMEHPKRGGLTSQ